MARERFGRSAAFLDLPENLCGLPVMPLSIRHVVTLDLIESPFVCGGRIPSADDIVNFLWLLNPRFEKSALAKRWFYLWRCRKLDYKTSVEAICAFVRDAFQDSIADGKSSVQYYSTAAGIIDILASEYGWTEAAILDLPVKRALQYVNAATQRRNPKAALFNPSDSIKARWIRQRDAALKDN